MPETILNRDFSAGWCPSDDQVNGRPNCLLQMDNLDLDRNGALVLSQGTEIIHGPLSAPAHTMQSRFINGVRCDYAACTDGNIFRNGTQIAAGGDATNAAFEAAFDYELICSGPERLKDSGVSTSNLGVQIPTIPPVVSINVNDATEVTVGSTVSNLKVLAGSAAVVSGYAQYTTSNSGYFIAQTYPGTLVDTTVLNAPDGTQGYSTDADIFALSGYTPNPAGVSIEIDILLDSPPANGDPVPDFYSYVITDLSQNAQFDSVSGVFTVNIPRSAFTINGTGAYDWSTVYGFRLTINNGTGDQVTTINIWGRIINGGVFTIRGGTTTQNGTYNYAQMNVETTASYQAQSELGPVTAPIQINQYNAQIQYQPPTDPLVNQVWIFRTGANLGGLWYRCAVVNAPFTPPYKVWDSLGDEAALTLNIQANLNMISVQNIPDKIMDILGPIQGRWYYFTTKFMYPSDINDPDLVNTSLAVRTCGSNSEMYMWARNVSAAVVIVGTNCDCYLLTGTFSTFPDGTIDVYYQSLGVKFPPITYDAVSYGGSVYYLAADGWRMVLPTSFGTTYSSQNNQLIIAPNLDRLYKGETCYGYPPPTMPTVPGSIRFPVTIAKNKIWCFPYGTGRTEVYDFLRNYWRPVIYNYGDVSACCSTQDNKVLACYDFDKKIREVDSIQSKLIDGQYQPTVKLLFPYKDNAKPRQRKDTYTLKIRGGPPSANTDGLIFQIIDETNYPTQVSGVVTSDQEWFFDLGIPFISRFPKSYQVSLTGTVPDFFLHDWSIDFDSHPIPLTFLRIQPTNLGSAGQKRIRSWPLILDTMGNSVLFTPNVDGVSGQGTTFSSNYRKTCLHQFVTDVFGTDYGGTIQAITGMFECWSNGVDGLAGGVTPDSVQNLPAPLQFDQVGPQEIFRWGKILRMALRTYSQGTPIPFTVYFSDASTYTGNFPVVPGIEDEYVVDLPKGASGRIIRVTLGPVTGFTFSRYFIKFQVAISGAQKDTELQWITIPGITSELARGI